MKRRLLALALLAGGWAFLRRRQQGAPSSGRPMLTEGRSVLSESVSDLRNAAGEARQVMSNAVRNTRESSRGKADRLRSAASQSRSTAPVAPVSVPTTEQPADDALLVPGAPDTEQVYSTMPDPTPSDFAADVSGPETDLEQEGRPEETQMATASTYEAVGDAGDSTLMSEPDQQPGSESTDDSDTPTEGLLEPPPGDGSSTASGSGEQSQQRAAPENDEDEHTSTDLPRSIEGGSGEDEERRHIEPTGADAQTREDLLSMNITPHSKMTSDDYRHVEASLPPETLEAIQHMDERGGAAEAPDLPIEEGFRVEAADGKVGAVARVVRGEGVAPYIVVKEGMIFKKEVNVALSAVDRVEGGTVYLNIEKQYLKLMEGEETMHTGDTVTRL